MNKNLNKKQCSVAQQMYVNMTFSYLGSEWKHWQSKFSQIQQQDKLRHDNREDNRTYF